jgi:predicted metal-dependent hydrolase
MASMTIERYFEAEGEAREEYLGSLSPEELLQLGIDLYNAGHYWNAHEAWEEVWLESERGMRGFYQGLIQVSAAFVHVTRNRYPGGVKLLGEGVEKLEKYPASFMSVELGPFVDGARAARARLIELGEARISEFDRALIPRIERTAGREGVS